MNDGASGASTTIVVPYDRAALQGSRRRDRDGYNILGLADLLRTLFRATRSDADDDVGKDKAFPARRFKTIRRRSQEPFRSSPSLGSLVGIQTTFRDEAREESGIEIPLHSRPVRELVMPLLQRLLIVRPVHMIELKTDTWFASRIRPVDGRPPWLCRAGCGRTSRLPALSSFCRNCAETTDRKVSRGRIEARTSVAIKGLVVGLPGPEGPARDGAETGLGSDSRRRMAAQYRQRCAVLMRKSRKAWTRATFLSSSV